MDPDAKPNLFRPPSPTPPTNTLPFPMESFPLPLESLYETPVPPFLFKTFDLVDDASLDAIISWGAKGESFVVWDPVEFARMILPRNFKHNNFSSFVRQLNTYGFRKIDTDKWEFANEGFVRGQRHLLKNIQRRKSPTSHQTGSSSGAELEDEIEHLRKERSFMMREVAELQHEQRGTVKQIESVNEKLEAAENRQKQMVSFLAKMFQNPAFLARVKQMKEQKSITSSRSQRKFVKHQPHLPGASGSSSERLIVERGPDFTIMPSESPLSYWPLQDIGENAVFGMEDVPLQDFGQDELAMVHELLDTPDKGKSVADTQYFVSFPEDLSMEKSIPEFSIQETEDVKDTLTGDMWNMSFEASSAGMSSSSAELWGNLSGYDVPEVGVSSGLSDIWDLGSLHPAGSSGNEKWPEEDFPLENPYSPA